LKDVVERWSDRSPDALQVNLLAMAYSAEPANAERRSPLQVRGENASEIQMANGTLFIALPSCAGGDPLRFVFRHRCIDRRRSGIHARHRKAVWTDRQLSQRSVNLSVGMLYAAAGAMLTRRKFT